MNITWANVTSKVRAQSRDTYERDLNLSQRIRYVQAYLLEKIWHTAQVFPAPTTCIRQLTTAIAWYIWKGATFRLANRLFRSRRDKEDGAKLTLRRSVELS